MNNNLIISLKNITKTFEGLDAPVLSDLNLHLNKSDWQDLTEEVFLELFKNSAVKRTKFAGLKRNIDFL